MGFGEFDSTDEVSGEVKGLVGIDVDLSKTSSPEAEEEDEEELLG